MYLIFALLALVVYIALGFGLHYILERMRAKRYETCRVCRYYPGDCRGHEGLNALGPAFSIPMWPLVTVILVFATTLNALGTAAGSVSDRAFRDTENRAKKKEAMKVLVKGRTAEDAK